MSDSLDKLLLLCSFLILQTKSFVLNEKQYWNMLAIYINDTLGFITLPTNVHLVRAMVFPVVMYGCESWTVKKAERWRTDAFELWGWRLLRVPWTARRSNQSILKISPGCSLEGLVLKLKLQYFGHLRRRVDSWKSPDAGRDWGQEEKGTREDEMAGWHHRLDGLSLSTPRELVIDRETWCAAVHAMGLQRVGHIWATELNWTGGLLNGVYLTYFRIKPWSKSHTLYNN